ncbi:MAG: hypothetical protein K1X74_19400 [Pirellulales bacterium]|nr:hypothetical protein [Pirellulales bacterium]
MATQQNAAANAQAIDAEQTARLAQELDDRQAVLEAQQRQLAAQADELEAFEARLTRDAEELDRREQELVEREQAVLSAGYTSYAPEAADAEPVEVTSDEDDSLAEAAGSEASLQTAGYDAYDLGAGDEAGDAGDSLPEEIEPQQQEPSLRDVLSRWGLTAESEAEEAHDASDGDTEESAAACEARDLHEEAEDADPAADGTGDEAEAAEPTAKQAPQAEEHHEETVEQYMARLMARVRQQVAENDAAAMSKTIEPLRPQTAARPGRQTPQPAVTAQPAERVRTAAPESKADLSALRELANESAKAHISQHMRKTLRQSTLGKAVVAIVALCCSAVLLSSSSSTSSTSFYMAIVSFGVAVVWGIQYALSTGNIMVSRIGSFNEIDEQDSPATEHADNDADADVRTATQATAWSTNAAGTEAPPEVGTDANDDSNGPAASDSDE